MAEAKVWQMRTAILATALLLAVSTTNAADKEGAPSVRITGWAIPDGFHGLGLGLDPYKMKSISSECLFEDNIIRNVTVLFQEKETK